MLSQVIIDVSKLCAQKMTVRSGYSVPFHIHSAFQKNVLHSCKVLGSDKASRRYEAAKRIAENPSIRDMAMTSGRKVTPVMIQMKLKNERISASYMNCVQVLKKAKARVNRQ